MNESTHDFAETPCYWTADPDEDPDLRGVCIRCGLDEELGDHSEPCTSNQESAE